LLFLLARDFSSGEIVCMTEVEVRFDKPMIPIAELAARPDFPHSAVGEYVDIAGFTGVIVEVIQNSIKVTAPEGFTRRFNYNRLRELYGPRPEPEPFPPPAAPEPAEPQAAPKPAEIQELNFDRPVKPVTEFFDRSDYPQSLVGELVDIGGYVGVVVSLDNQSIKVRSREGTSRKYNAAFLPKVHGGSQASN
jgi:hypothetical protein